MCAQFAAARGFWSAIFGRAPHGFGAVCACVYVSSKCGLSSRAALLTDARTLSDSVRARSGYLVSAFAHNIDRLLIVLSTPPRVSLRSRAVSGVSLFLSV